MATVTAIETLPAHLPSPSWAERLRLLVGAGIIWACMHYVVDDGLLWRGDARPVVLMASQAGFVRGLLAVALLGVLALLIGLVMPRRDGTGPLTVFGLALVCWAAIGGTMDDWLILRHPTVTGGDGGPFFALIADYVVLLVAVVALVKVFGYDGRDHGPDDRPNWRAVLGADGTAADIQNGVVHLVVGVVVAAVVIYLLAGPGLEHTHRGQVVFGVAVGCMAAVSAARSVTGPAAAIWSWPVPFVVGLLGLILAGFSPRLPGPLAGLDVFPPWGGLARALPVEMVGVGLVAIIYTHRAWRRAD
jgi:hypothetical protein